MYRVVVDVDRPDPALVERYRHLSWYALTQVIGVHRFMDPGIQPIVPDWWVCGPAVTISVPARDYLIVRAANNEVVRPGDVVVIDARGRSDFAAWGGGLSRIAKAKGVAGAVVDGGVLRMAPYGVAEVHRQSYAALGFPIFCRGMAIEPAPAEGPGSINVPVSCGGVVVEPGDLVLGCSEYVCVVPRLQIEPAIEQLEAMSAEVHTMIESLDSNSPFWNAEELAKLKAAGVEWVQG